MWCYRASLVYGVPLYVEGSHGADEFGEFALNRSGGAPVRAEPERRAARAWQGGGALSWMG